VRPVDGLSVGLGRETCRCRQGERHREPDDESGGDAPLVNPGATHAIDVLVVENGPGGQDRHTILPLPADADLRAC
jgi:hypothetical protein